MFELLLFGTVWFWIIVSIAAIFIFISLENDDWGGTGATWTVIIFGVLYWFFGGREFFNSIWDTFLHDPGKFFGYVLSYVGIGLAWSFVKWYFYLLNAKEKLQRQISKKMNTYSFEIPKAANHKGDIIAWMTYWPFSALWTLINDPVKRLFRFIYGKFENVYQKMSDSMFADLKDQLKD